MYFPNIFASFLFLFTSFRVIRYKYSTDKNTVEIFVIDLLQNKVTDTFLTKEFQFSSCLVTVFLLLFLQIYVCYREWLQSQTQGWPLLK